MSTSPPDPPSLSAHVAWCHQLREAAIESLELIHNGARLVMVNVTGREHNFTHGDEAQQQEVAEHLTAFLLAQGEDMTGRVETPARRILPGPSAEPDRVVSRSFGLVGDDGRVTPVRPEGDR